MADSGESTPKPAEPAAAAVPPATLSKKKQKRLARLGGEAGIQAHWEKKKAAYKERVKERKLEEKEKQQQEWLSLSVEEQEQRKKEASQRREAADKEKEEHAKLIKYRTENKGELPQIIIDCDFEGEMDPKALKSMAQQIALSHSFMRKESLPCWLTISGLEKTGTLHKQLSQRCRFADWSMSTYETKLPATVKALNSGKVVYLTGDSDAVLETLDANTSYIVGGIIDRNRCKGLTLKKANELGYSHARLPLDTWIESNKLQGICKTLTTNHVVSILTLFAKCKSWEESFSKVLPMRRVVEQQQKKKEKSKDKNKAPEGDQTPKKQKLDEADPSTG